MCLSSLNVFSVHALRLGGAGRSRRRRPARGV
jgi:hypothetical protein